MTIQAPAECTDHANFLLYAAHSVGAQRGPRLSINQVEAALARGRLMSNVGPIPVHRSRRMSSYEVLARDRPTLREFLESWPCSQRWHTVPRSRTRWTRSADEERVGRKGKLLATGVVTPRQNMSRCRRCLKPSSSCFPFVACWSPQRLAR